MPTTAYTVSYYRNEAERRPGPRVRTLHSARFRSEAAKAGKLKRKIDRLLIHYWRGVSPRDLPCYLRSVNARLPTCPERTTGVSPAKAK